MASDGVQNELLTVVADRLQLLGTNLVRGIVIQELYDDEPTYGNLHSGVPIRPFWSVCSVLPEQYDEQKMTNRSDFVVRPVHVFLVADRMMVQQEGMEAYRTERQRGIRVCQALRVVLTDPTARLHKVRVQPQSQLQIAAWKSRNIFASGFDVNFHLCETRAWS